jgi:hypothetical protein
VKSKLSKTRLILLAIALTGLVVGCARTMPLLLLAPKSAGAMSVSSIPVTNAVVNTLDPACLVGKWSVSNLQQMMYQSYLQSDSNFQLEDITGQAQYAFDSQGGMTITFDQLSAEFSGQVDGQRMKIQQVLEGTAESRYSLDKTTGRLMLTNFTGDGIVFALEINGQRLVEGNFPAWRAFTTEAIGEVGKPTSLVEYAQVQVDCSGDQMTIQAVDPLPGPLVVLEAVR